MRRRSRRERSLRMPAGRPAQAITEYSLVVFVVLGLGIIAGWDLIPLFINSFQKYFDSFYIMLNLPIP
jgi:hypothetical protein